MRGFVWPAAVALAASAAWGQQSKAVDDAVLKNSGKTGTEWLSYGLTPGETRYSPLSQINASNVSRLGLAWSYDIGQGGGGQEATPLVWNGTIYSITNWSVVYAVDARTGKERWRWDPQVNRTALAPVLCCGAVLRGLAIYEGKIVAPILDGRLDALDAETGKEIWEARVAFPQDIYTITMAPRIAKGKVIIGVAGGEYPTRGFFAAYDANTGQFAWKFYTVPGDPSKPFESEAMKKAAATWSGAWWKTGGGAPVWDAISYDPDANLLYVGTGNAGPWAEAARGQKESDGKDNLYACSILAVNPDTGALKWYFQAVPGDEWDFDSVQQIVLADLNIKGQTRKVLMQAGKNGFYYVIDRLTGKFISGQPFVQVNWAKGLNEANGRPIFNSEAFYGADSIAISPGAAGAHNWSPMSYNPTSGLVYIPATVSGSSSYAVDPNYEYHPGQKNKGTGTGVNKLPPPPAIGPELPDGIKGGALVAWDPITQTRRWIQPGGGGIGGGTVTTAGNLVFQVVNDGRLLAYSADKGEKLLDIQTGLRGGMGPPITFQLDGKQYVTVTGGIGTGVPPRPAAIGEAPRTASNAPTSLPKLLMFVLDGKAQITDVKAATRPDAKE
jgi:quinohemoprotein ethanol dehydrogenase